jgi:hypothetical protein
MGVFLLILFVGFPLYWIIDLLLGSPGDGWVVLVAMVAFVGIAYGIFVILVLRHEKLMNEGKAKEKGWRSYAKEKGYKCHYCGLRVDENDFTRSPSGVYTYGPFYPTSFPLAVRGWFPLPAAIYGPPSTTTSSSDSALAHKACHSAATV